MVCEELGNVTWRWVASEFVLQAKQVGEAAGGRVWRSGWWLQELHSPWRTKLDGWFAGMRAANLAILHSSLRVFACGGLFASGQAKKRKQPRLAVRRARLLRSSFVFRRVRARRPGLV